MRITKALAALVVVFNLTGYGVSGYIPENSRQGSDPVFADSAPGPTPSVSAFTAGFVAWDTTNRIGHRIWGNFRWPDKPGHGVKPCRDEELGDLLDRLDFGRSFGGPGHDPYHYGRHFAATISPYLYASRRFDTFSQTYFNRWRSYNPRVGRFNSADPLGFEADINLYRYANGNPVRFLDPFGLTIETAIDLLSGSSYHYFYNLLQGAYGLGTPTEINWDEIDRILREMAGNPCLASVRDEILTDPGYKKFKVIRTLDQIFKSHNFSKEEITEAVERITKFIQKYQMDDPRVAAIIRQVIEEILNRRP